MAVINKEVAYMALPLSIRRGNPFPLDEYAVWYDKVALEEYAKTSPVAYVGQVVVLVDEDSSSVEAYVIQNVSGDLTKLAASTSSGDLAEDVLTLQNKVSALETSVGTKGEDSAITATAVWAALDEINTAYKAADQQLTTTLSTNYYDKSATDTAIDNKIAVAISSTYKAAGSVAFASLPTPSAVEAGKVYNVTDQFTTTEQFVEGAGQQHPAGTNVVCIESSDEVYKWDVLSGFVDLSGYVHKEPGKSLVEDTLIERLNGIEAGAQVNVIESVTVNGKPLSVSGKTVNVPVATAETEGVVKSSEALNGVQVNGDGSMEVHSLNITKLTQQPEDTLILNGGNAQ